MLFTSPTGLLKSKTEHGRLSLESLVGHYVHSQCKVSFTFIPNFLLVKHFHLCVAIKFLSACLKSTPVFSKDSLLTTAEIVSVKFRLNCSPAENARCSSQRLSWRSSYWAIKCAYCRNRINPVVAQQYGSTVLGMWVSHVRQTAARRGCV